MVRIGTDSVMFIKVISSFLQKNAVRSNQLRTAKIMRVIIEPIYFLF